MSEEDEIEKLLAETTAPETQDLDIWDPSNAEVIVAIKEYARLRGLYERLSKAKKEAEASVDRLESSLTSVFLSRGVKTLKVEGVGTLSTSTKIKPVVRDDERLNAWLESIGEGALISHKVHYMRLASWLSDRASLELPLPDPEVCEVTAVTGLRFTKSKTL